jgi:hypothetical protein
MAYYCELVQLAYFLEQVWLALMKLAAGQKRLIGGEEEGLM